MAEFLFELRVEEIPAGFLPDALADLTERVRKGLAEAGLLGRRDDRVVRHATAARPPHLAASPTEIPERRPRSPARRRRPPSRTTAASPPPPSASRRPTGSTRRRSASSRRRRGSTPPSTKTLPAVPAVEVLGEAAAGRRARRSPGRRRCAGERGRSIFVRPVHGVVALFGGEVVPTTLFGVASGRTTVGHRATGGKTIEVAGFDDYRARSSRPSGVVIDAAERRRALVETAAKLRGRLREGIDRREAPDARGRASARASSPT